MRNPRLETKAQTFAGPGLSRKTEIVCAFWVAFSRRQVNQVRIAGLLFGRDLLLAGLACLGWPWSRRLSLWVDWLDQRSEELRAISEGKI